MLTLSRRLAQCKLEERPQADLSIHPDENSTYLDLVAQDVLLNDLIMSKILSYIPHTCRKNIDMASRRLYHLSARTPTFLNRKLRLEIREQRGQEYKPLPEKLFLIMIEAKNLETDAYQPVTGTSASVVRKEIGEALKFFAKRFSKEVVRITIEDKIDRELIEIFDLYFKQTTELFCCSLRQDALDFLTLQTQTISSRIKKLGLFEFYEIERTSALVGFNNLSNITYIGSMRGMEHFLSQATDCNLYVETISIRNKPVADVIVLALSSFCNYFRFHYPYGLRPVYGVPGILNASHISKLDLTLSYFSTEDLAAFFSRVDIFKMQSVSLTHAKFNSKLLRVFENKSDSVLTSLTLNNFLCVDNGADFLLSICPSSLRRLKVNFSDVGRRDFNYILNNCPLLEVIKFEPMIFRSSEQTLILYEYYAAMFNEFQLEAKTKLLRLKKFRSTYFPLDI